MTKSTPAIITPTRHHDATKGDHSECKNRTHPLTIHQTPRQRDRFLRIKTDHHLKSNAATLDYLVDREEERGNETLSAAIGKVGHSLYLIADGRMTGIIRKEDVRALVEKVSSDMDDLTAFLRRDRID